MREFNKQLKTYLQTILGDISKRSMEEFLEITNREWEDSKESNFSHYYDPNYNLLMWHCYNQFSKGNISLCYKTLQEEDIDSIVDMGAGIGATTSLIKHYWPNSSVYYNNLPANPQVSTALSLFKIQQLDIRMSLETFCMPHADLVFALEFFEHIKDPFKELDDILQLNPKFICMANSWRVKSYGHHSIFKKGEEDIPNTKIAREFNNYLKSKGYQIDDRCTSFWRGRPAIWRRTGLSSEIRI